jgi:hypothetical protein
MRKSFYNLFSQNPTALGAIGNWSPDGSGHSHTVSLRGLSCRGIGLPVGIIDNLLDVSALVPMSLPASLLV